VVRRCVLERGGEGGGGGNDSRSGGGVVLCSVHWSDLYSLFAPGRGLPSAELPNCRSDSIYKPATYTTSANQHLKLIQDLEIRGENLSHRT
jgi:hypothetical protein